MTGVTFSASPATKRKLHHGWNPAAARDAGRHRRGILCFAFLKIVGEPQVDRAIAFETQLDEAKAKAKADAEMAKGMSMPKEEPQPELVSRPVQAGIGLFTGVMVYNAAFGGLFALVFALTYGRMGDFGPRETSAVVGAGGHCRRLYRPEPEISGQPAFGRRPRYDRYAHGRCILR